MLLYLEGTRCKVDNALADIEGRQRINNPITQYMRHQRDKQGFPQTILKVRSKVKLITSLELRTKQNRLFLIRLFCRSTEF